MSETDTPVTLDPLAVARRINAISQSLVPIFQVVDAAYVAARDGRDTVKREAAWAKAAADYNRAVDAVLPEIASLTHNSVSTLRQVFQPRDAYSTPLTPDFLRNVAHYASFKAELWTAHSGQFREPTYPFGSLDPSPPSMGMSPA